MELLVLLLIIPVLIGLALQAIIAVISIALPVVAGMLVLILRFWYLALAMMLILLFPLIYLNQWSNQLLAVLTLIAGGYGLLWLKDLK